MAESSIYKQTFEEYDKDKSGFIDFNELENLIKTLLQKSESDQSIN